LSRTVSSSAPSGTWFRGDINGLRVLAIIPVVAFHADLTLFGGGFVGVDVFYVISGYLITMNLLREVESTGSIRLWSFWGKRVRRLLPAAGTMVLITTPLAMLVLSPLQWSELGKQSAATLLYLSNFLFAQQATDYFAADLASPSPFLHTWSLSVEEQFYVIWPVIVILAALLARKLGVPVRRVLLAAFGSTILASLALSIFWTESDPSAAFYLLPTRAWEFALAGLLAMLPATWIGSRATRVAFGLSGAALLFGSILLMDSSTAFPGSAALIPVLATLLFIVGGRRKAGEDQHVWPSKLLNAGPMQWLGTLSYSWYLWHWPFIVLISAAVGNESPLLKSAAALGALVAACATYYFVENPVRFDRRLTQSLRRTFIAAGVVTVIVGSTSAIAFAQGEAVLDRNVAILEARSEKPDQDCARNSVEHEGVELCEMGDLTSDITVLFMGDSHAGHLKDALGQAALEEGIRLVVRWKASCPAIGIDTVNSSDLWGSDCRPYQRATMSLADSLDVDGILISQSEAYDGRLVDSKGGQLTLEEQRTLWTSSYERTLDDLKVTAPKIGVVLDNPRFEDDPNDCLVRTFSDAAECAVPRANALEAVSVLQTLTEAVIATRAIDAVFTTTDTLCDPNICNVMVDGVPVYMDYNHLSRQWTLTQVPALRELLAAVS
jgi:peptidoglycan/LPS O-acetylase OafA/YrhL